MNRVGIASRIEDLGVVAVIRLQDPSRLRAVIEAIARAVPANLEELGRIEGVRRWQVENVGDDLLAALSPSA